PPGRHNPKHRNNPTPARVSLCAKMRPNTTVTRPSRARRRETHGTRKTENSPLEAGLGRAPRGQNMFFCGHFGYDHTWPNAPYPVRFVKLSGHRPC
ncbi:uncharacterized protein TM35_000931100, partial [Trypanosoma theileri]